MKTTKLTLKTAYKKARKLWGKTACVEDKGTKRGGTAQQRDQARSSQRERIERLTQEKGHKRNWTPQERMEVQDLGAASFRYRFTVGHIMMGMFFSVKGQGDTWEEAFAKAEGK